MCIDIHYVPALQVLNVQLLNIPVLVAELTDIRLLIHCTPTSLLLAHNRAISWKPGFMHVCLDRLLWLYIPHCLYVFETND